MKAIAVFIGAVLLAWALAVLAQAWYVMTKGVVIYAKRP